MYKKINPDNKIFNSPEFQKDKYKFNIVSKILAGDEVLLNSDEKNILKLYIQFTEFMNKILKTNKKETLEEIKEKMENQIKQKHLYCWKNKGISLLLLSYISFCFLLF